MQHGRQFFGGRIAAKDLSIGFEFPFYGHDFTAQGKRLPIQRKAFSHIYNAPNAVFSALKEANFKFANEMVRPLGKCSS